jgi:hypothetical protein
MLLYFLNYSQHCLILSANRLIDFKKECLLYFMCFAMSIRMFLCTNMYTFLFCHDNKLYSFGALIMIVCVHHTNMETVLQRPSVCFLRVLIINSSVPHILTTSCQNVPRRITALASRLSHRLLTSKGFTNACIARGRLSARLVLVVKAGYTKEFGTMRNRLTHTWQVPDSYLDQWLQFP